MSVFLIRSMVHQMAQEGDLCKVKLNQAILPIGSSTIGCWQLENANAIHCD